MATNYLEISDFNAEIYRISPDLRRLSQEDLIHHYLNYGIKEGRFYNTIVDRKSFLESIDKRGKMLEISPLSNPQLNAKSPGYYSVDAYDAKGLSEKYKNDSGIKSEKIIEPNFVVTNHDYSKITEKFNCVFSSHNIQHAPCVVSFLNNLESILDSNGSINLVIPDKRYCFDYFKNETSIYDVIQLYHDKPSKPRLSDVLRMKIQSTHNDSQAHWDANGHGVDLTEIELPKRYAAILKEYETGKYIDAHVSYFTPASFMSIINVLKDMRLINLKIHRLYHTLNGALEFYVILKRNVS